MTLNCGLAWLGSAYILGQGTRRRRRSRTHLFSFSTFICVLWQRETLCFQIYCFFDCPHFLSQPFIIIMTTRQKNPCILHKNLIFFFFFQLLLFCGLDSEFQEQNSAEPSCFDLTIYIYFWFKVKIMHVMHRSSTPHMKWSKMVQSTDSVLLE